MKQDYVRPIYVKHRLSNVLSVSKIVTIHYFEFDKNFTHGGEVHDFWELVYVDSGEIIASAGNKRHTLRRGEIIFHKPNEFHALSANGKNVSNVFVISFVTTAKAMSFFKNKKFVLPDSLKKLIAMIMKEGQECFYLPFNDPELRELKLKEKPPFGGLQLIRMYLEELLILMLRNENTKSEMPIFTDKESLENNVVSRSIQLLEENVYGRITVDEICKKLNYSRSYISRLFVRNCGVGMAAYYAKIKVEEAKKLIREGYSFAEISDMLMFDNQHYFSRVFKRVTNMTPREYKKSARRRV